MQLNTELNPELEPRRTLERGQRPRIGAGRSSLDAGPTGGRARVTGTVGAAIVSIEVIAELTHSLSLGRLLVTLGVVGAAAMAFRILLHRQPAMKPRAGPALLLTAAVLQCAVIAGIVGGVTWWFPLVPALFASWALPRRADPASTGRSLAVRAAAVATLIGTGPVFSLAATLVQPSADPMSLRAVEWLRLRGGERVVNGVEHWWYSHHQPKAGGLPEIPISVPPTVAVRTGRGSAVSTTPAALVPSTVRSATIASPKSAAPTTITPVRPLVTDPVPGEGQWTAIVGPAARPAVAVTRVRPDPIHTSVVVALARMDPSLVRISLVAGTEDPGGSWPERGKVPMSQRSALLAVFNSGFRQRESGGGFWIGGRQGAALVDGVASLVIRKDGTATVAQWGRDASLDNSVAAVRQNLALIVDNGAPVAGLEQGNNRRWGRTVGGKVLVWRSGIGVTKDGALIYAGGPGMSIASLANVLTAAGTVRAMELDINSAWVAYFLYSQTPTGPQGTRLLPSMRHAPTRYLNSQSRDFVMVLSR